MINYGSDPLDTSDMLPKHVDVQLHDGKWVTVAVSDLCNMIKSLLTDESLMKPENLAEGVDIFTGKVTGDDSKYSEFHTGDLWKSARSIFVRKERICHSRY